MTKLDAVHWVAKYNDGTVASSHYDKLDRDRLVSFELYDGTDLVQTVIAKDVIYRKRSYLNGNGKHLGSIYLLGVRGGPFVAYEPISRQLLNLTDPDIELTPNELLPI